MRIGIDARVLVHPPTGVARYLRALLEEYPELRREGERLELLVDHAPRADDAAGLRGRGETRAVDPSRGDRFTVLGWPLPGGDPAWRQLRMPPRLWRAAPDVLFCPFYTVPLATRTPRVVTIHDVSFLAHPEWFSRRARAAFRLVAPSARASRRILTVSAFSAGEIVRSLGVDAGRVEVIPPGIDASWFRAPDDRDRTSLRAWLGFDGPYLLHLGAVQRRRNPVLLHEGFARVSGRHPGVRLVVAGPALDDSDPFAGDTARAPGDRVIRRPWVEERLVRALVAEAAALVYLSSYEGFGLPALEALAAGTPVVALRRASLPEVLGDTAEWIDEPEPEAVARAIDRLLAEPTRAAELASAGPERAGRFSPRSASAATFDVLRDAAERN